MARIKRLKSVVHSLGHHGMSGFSALHPHIGEACKENGITSISINLIHEGFSPEIKTITKELNLSTNTLRKTFVEFLKTESYSITEIENGFIMFNFSNSVWPASCYLKVTTIQNKTIEVALDPAGKKATILDNKS